VKEGAPDEEELLMAVMEVGGEDLEDNDDVFVVVTGPNDLESVRKGLEAAGIQVEEAELAMRAKVPATVTAETAKKVFRLIDNLEDSDDVQDVYHNMDITEEIAVALDL